jgi:hypothetical protein
VKPGFDPEEPPGRQGVTVPLNQDVDSSLGKKFLDIPEARREPVIQPDGVTDDLGREPVSVAAASIGFHQPCLRGADSI